MATTIVPATLKVTVSEKVTLNNKERGASNTFAAESITQFHERIITIPPTAASASPIELASFSDDSTGAGTFKDTDLAHGRITNLDSSNAVLLRFTAQSSANNSFTVQLPAGKSFLLPSNRIAVTTTGEEWPITEELGTISCFYESVPTSSVDLEIVVGQTAN